MNFLRKYIQILVVAGLVTPLLFSTKVSFPYIFTQVTYFHFIVFLLAIPLFWLWIWDKNSRPRNSIILRSLSFFVFAIFISGLLSQDSHKSLFGVWERFGDAVDWLMMYVYFLAFITVFKNKKHWLNVFRIIAGISVFISAWAILQLVPETLLFSTGSRVFASLGNPAFLASYLLIAIGISAYLLFEDRRSYNYIYGTALIVQAVAIYMSGTRAALLGLFVMVLIGFSVWIKNNTLKTKRVVILIAAVAFMSLAIGVSFSKFDESRIDILGSKTIGTRFISWDIAYQGFLDKPLLGWGENNFSTVFYRHYNPMLFEGSHFFESFDKSHNEYFDRLVLGGVIGFVLYLMLILSPLIINRSKLLSNSSRNILIYTLIGYYVYLIFFFHSINDTILFIVLLAWFHSNKTQKKVETISKTSVPLLIVILAIVMSFGVAILHSGKSVVASSLIRSAQFEENIQMKLSLYASAWELSKSGRRVIVSDAGSNVPYPWIYDVIQRHKYDMQFWMQLVQIQRHRAQFDEELTMDAIATANATILLSPTHPAGYLLKGLLYLDSGNAESIVRAQENFDKAIELAPHNHEAFILSALARTIMQGDNQLIQDYITVHGNGFNPQEKMLALDALEYLKE